MFRVLHVKEVLLLMSSPPKTARAQQAKGVQMARLLVRAHMLEAALQRHACGEICARVAHSRA